jgi:hypothetical protein
MSGLVLAFIIVGVLIVLAAAGGVGYYFYTQRDSPSISSATSSDSPSTDTTTSLDGSVSNPDVTKALAQPTPGSPVVLAPEGTTAASLIAQAPVTTAKGNTSSFVALTPDAIPKTKSGKPTPAPKDTVWIGQKVTSSTGKTITVPVLVPTKPPKQNIVTKDASGNPLGKLPKGMVWVKKTIRKGSKSVTVIVMEKKV